MAQFRGKDVVVTFGGQTISGDGRSVSYEETSETHDDTTYGLDNKTKISGLLDGSGSFEALDTTGDWSLTWEAIAAGAAGTLVIWPEGAGSSFREVSFEAVITTRSLELPYDDLAKFSMAFEINGAVTEGNQPV